MLADTFAKSKTVFCDYELDAYSFSEQNKDWEALNDLPTLLKILVVTISAKPLPGLHPLSIPPIVYIVWCALSIAIGVAASSLGLRDSGISLLLVPWGWVLTLHGTRLLRLTLQHAAAHNSVLKHSWANTLLGEVSSIVTISTDFRSYKRAHMHTHHNLQKLMTPGDETYSFWTQDLRLNPGATLRELQRSVITSLVSPFYHSRRFSHRVVACFASSSLHHNVWSCLFWGSILFLIVHAGYLRFFLVSWLIPISVLFECCSVLRQLVEHRCPTLEDPRMTAAIYLTDTPPPVAVESSCWKIFVSWGYWWLKLFTVHFLSRLLVLPGDSPNHPKHHNDPGAKDWRNHIYARSERYDYPENFGLSSAILDSLQSWEQSGDSRSVNVQSAG